MMGEARKKSFSKAEIFARQSVCVYCSKPDSLDDQLEHMPPRSLFKNKHRPDGWTFRACAKCNYGTRGADAVMSLITSLGPDSGVDIDRVKRLQRTVEKYAPDASKDIEDRFRQKDLAVYLGIDKNSHHTSVRLNGAGIERNLSLFLSKFALAAYCELTGAAIGENCYIWGSWYLNGGLSRDFIDGILDGLPGYGALKQGQMDSTDQFEYKYNTDGVSNVAIAAHFRYMLTAICFISCSGEVVEILKQYGERADIEGAGNVFWTDSKLRKFMTMEFP